MDSTPTGLFSSFEEEFTQIIQGVHEKLDKSGAVHGEQRKAALRKVEVDLDEADDIVSQLELAAKGIPRSILTPYTSRLTQAKAELGRAKKRAREVHLATGKVELLGRGDGPTTSDDPYRDIPTDRTRLLAGTETLADGSRRITETQRLALEAEDIGADILRNLRVQREGIETARDTLNKADTNISRSSNTIQKMIRGMYKQRIILSVIGVFFILLIAFILWFKLKRH